MRRESHRGRGADDALAAPAARPRPRTTHEQASTQWRSTGRQFRPGVGRPVGIPGTMTTTRSPSPAHLSPPQSGAGTGTVPVPVPVPESPSGPGWGEGRGPRHIAVILDGNRRWAARHGTTLPQAYRQGADRVYDLALWCEEAGIGHVTVWALSTDNLARPPETVEPILQAVTDGLQRMASVGRWRIRAIGEVDRLPPEHLGRLRAVERRSEEARGMTINVALAYDGRHDIVNAVVELLHRHATQPLDGLAVEDLLARYLSTAGQPEIDLVVRTSGEQRLSGFMPWQTAFSELYFTDTAWPDFDHDDFRAALAWYAGRQRRHGR
ncbi:polyprenyl diphosphate synthase [Streptomyces laurentii]|uniref:polyprenyl diphosphate synthase n=1 Tax=Streptomyces laurentii TaxID=39478 RepID=UPI00367E5E77